MINECNDDCLPQQTSALHIAAKFGNTAAVHVLLHYQCVALIIVS